MPLKKHTRPIFPGAFCSESKRRNTKASRIEGKRIDKIIKEDDLKGRGQPEAKNDEVELSNFRVRRGRATAAAAANSGYHRQKPKLIMFPGVR
ncbi:hypothetical protein PV327_007200 [Microctonus hyperodae]|uniref:Uncharacterized protein n=1 Tax=Microctonus hyperodae TaxID=165561 RepID=A0AA39KJE0_MICHY|nr:hypothetical protein PV327_007200 [Microctonus hyperodae]